MIRFAGCCNRKTCFDPTARAFPYEDKFRGSQICWLGWTALNILCLCSVLNHDFSERDSYAVSEIVCHGLGEFRRCRDPELRANKNCLVLITLGKVQEYRVFSFVHDQQILESMQVCEALLLIELNVDH